MRYSEGYVRKQRGRWLGAWYVTGKRTSQTLGFVKDLSKSEARERLAELIRQSKQSVDRTLFGPFVEGPYFDFYSRKWKASTAENNKQRIRTHLVTPYRERPLPSFKRDELQDLLDAKAKTHSFSVVDHLRWDAKQIFDMAIAEGLIKLNPALLLFTPKEAPKPLRPVMRIDDVRAAFAVLAREESLICKLAIVGGMRPGEIFVLTWDRIGETFAKVERRIYRGLIDTPKSHHSIRAAALANRLMTELLAWRSMSGTGHGSFVFPSERGTALSKDNVWRRRLQPKLASVGLGWCNFQVMRRTHATLMRQLKADPHQVAAQLGHTVDVSLNVYAQSPVEGRLALVNQLENLIQ
jgi:integrase